ncbi:MAG: DUF6314 family protein [Bacteriovoracia bacterium]
MDSPKHDGILEKYFSHCLLIDSVFICSKSAYQNIDGKGKVKSFLDKKKRIVTEESGCWSQLKSNISFRNVYRWTMLPETNQIMLEHLRFGGSKPVYLGVFSLKKKDIWTMDKAHFCGRDQYLAKLKFEKNRIQLKWQIAEPQKKQILELAYLIKNEC